MKSIFLYVLLLLLAIAPLTSSEECHETVKIDSVEYPVGARWCGRKLDTTLFADASKLVRIPAEFCANDYRIYVTRPTRDAFVKMAQAAKKNGIDLIAESGYRSSRYQRTIIKKRLAAGDSFKQIMKYVAPPGYSEHETGRALDLSASDASFVNSDAYKWLKKNAAEFGFTETYPKEKAGIMPYEPWHWCYKKSE